MSRRLTARVERFTLHTPFRIARGVRHVADLVTVEIADGDHVGRGEGAPTPRYGESVESVLAEAQGAADAIAAGATRDDLIATMPAGAARNAVDCALWDLEARLAGIPVATRLGTPAGPVATALTIGIDTPEAMAAVAARYRAAPLLKVKVDRDDPLARLRAVRAAAPSPRLIVDANESWTVEDVDRLMRDLVPLRVDLLEQPVPAGADDALLDIAPTVPIAADEALHTRGDLDRLAGRYGVVNIKLDKTGGLTEALALAADARARGFGIMTGCMISSSLGIAPAWHIAAASAFADLDGPLWLADDRPGGFVAADGVLMPAAPGFWGGAADAA